MLYFRGSKYNKFSIKIQLNSIGLTHFSHSLNIPDLLWINSLELGPDFASKRAGRLSICGLNCSIELAESFSKAVVKKARVSVPKPGSRDNGLTCLAAVDRPANHGDTSHDLLNNGAKHATFQITPPSLRA